MTTLISNLDLNRRSDPFLSQIEFISSNNLKQIATLAIPFLSLHQGCGTLISLGSAAGQVYHELSSENPDLMKIASLATTASLFMFNPKLALYLTNGATLVFETYDIAQDALQGKTDKLGEKGWKLLSTATYLASVYTSSPLLVMTSLMLQAFKEFQEAYREFDKGNHLESAAKCFMGLIRSFKAQAQAKEFYREKFGREMTQSDWDQVIQELQEKIHEKGGSSEGKNDQTLITQKAWNLLEKFLWGSSNLEQLLDKNNFKRQIKEIRLNDTDLEDIVLRNLSFTKCHLNKADFTDATIENVHFDQCLMKGARFICTEIRGSTISSSDLSESVFYKCDAHDFKIIDSDLTRSCFNESTLEKMEIISSRLFGANFFSATVKDSLIKLCDLTNVLLVDAKEQFQYESCSENYFTRPVIALGWDFRYGGFGDRVEEALKDQDALSLRYSYKIETVNINDLREEVMRGIREYEDTSESIPQHLMRKGSWGKETKSLRECAQKIIKYADGSIIPGGEDVEEEFYRKDVTWGGWDHRRSMIEYEIIHECVTQKKPMWNICRGAQITNTYFPNGTIKDVDGQWGTQKIEFVDTPSGDVLKNAFGEACYGESMHSQAVEEIGEGLEVAMKADNVIKALLNKDGTILLTQFHPELYTFAAQIERNDASILKEISWDLSSDDERDLFIFNENHQIEVDRQALEVIIRRFENSLNETIKKIIRLRNNETIVKYFLARVQDHSLQVT